MVLCFWDRRISPATDSVYGVSAPRSYTVVPLVPVDEDLGTVGHVTLGPAAAIVGGLVGSLILGTNVFGPRIELFSVVIALIGAVVAIVGWKDRRGPLAKGRL